MQPLLYKKLLKLIQTNHLKTLTIDVFDTILLNDYWPKALRHQDLARKWITDIYRITTLQPTSYELWDLRRYAEQELQAVHQCARIDLIIDIMLDILCLKYHITLSSEERLELMAAMIATELQFKIMNTHPNHNLIAQIANLKQACPGLKVYFLADTNFCAEQIRTMLDILEVKIFDGGLTSSDTYAKKQTGTLYEKLAENFGKDFDLARNLHLGDRRIPDYLMPILHDSYAVHCRPVRMRGLRTLIGKTAFKIIDTAAMRRNRKIYRKLSSDITTTNTEWEQYGSILAGNYATWNWQVSIRAQILSNYTFLLPKDLTALKVATDNTNITNTALDQALILKAFAWLLATFETTRWNAPELMHLVCRAVGKENRIEIYQFCLGADVAVSDLALQSFSDAEFFQELLNEIKTSNTDATNNLRSSYETVLALLPQNEQPLCIVTQNNDNVAMLFREFARLHGIANTIDEWILDHDGAILAAQQKLDSQINPRRTRYLKRGEQHGAALLSHSELAPDHYARTILKPALKQILKTLK